MSPAALSRRAAVFGAALAPMALAGSAALATTRRQFGDESSDARLTVLAADLCSTLDGAAYAFDPVADEADQDRRLDRANALQLEIAGLPAVGLAGVLAKAKAYLDSNSYDVVNLAELADSLAEDVERVLEGRSA